MVTCHPVLLPCSHPARFRSDPQHAKEVEKASEVALRAELRAATRARAMVDGKLGHAPAALEAEHRNQAVLLAIEVKRPHGGSAIGLQPAVHVVKRDPGQVGGEPIEDPRAPALDERVLTVLLPA